MRRESVCNNGTSIDQPMEDWVDPLMNLDVERVQLAMAKRSPGMIYEHGAHGVGMNGMEHVSEGRINRLFKALSGHIQGACI